MRICVCCIAIALWPAVLAGCGIPGAPEEAAERPAPPPAEAFPVAPPPAELPAEPVDAELPAEPGDAEVAQFMRSWQQLAEAEADDWDVTNAHIIAQHISQSPSGLHPFLDVIEDPDEEPLKKVFALVSILPYLTEDYAPRLVAMTASEHETTTRAVSTHMLAYLDTPEAQARVRALIDDEEHRVRASATLVLAALEDEEAIALLPALWQEGTDDDREQILLSVPEEQVAEHLDMYKEGMLNHEVQAVSRERLATLLGRVGDERVLEVLDEAARHDPAPSVRLLARSAREAVLARVGEGDVPAPVEEAAPALEPEMEPGVEEAALEAEEPGEEEAGLEEAGIEAVP